MTCHCLNSTTWALSLFLKSMSVALDSLISASGPPACSWLLMYWLLDVDFGLWILDCCSLTLSLSVTFGPGFVDFGTEDLLCSLQAGVQRSFGHGRVLSRDHAADADSVARHLVSAGWSAILCSPCFYFPASQHCSSYHTSYYLQGETIISSNFQEGVSFNKLTCFLSSCFILMSLYSQCPARAPPLGLVTPSCLHAFWVQLFYKSLKCSSSPGAFIFWFLVSNYFLICIGNIFCYFWPSLACPSI